MNTKDEFLGHIEIDGHRWRYGFSPRVLFKFCQKHTKNIKSFEDAFINYPIELIYSFVKRFNRPHFRMKISAEQM